jgi:uncharacterized protein (DUF1810 family)
MYDKERKVLVVFYVDDIIVLYHERDETAAKLVIDGMRSLYELTELGDCQWFLGIRILRDRVKRTVELVHDVYIEKVASRFGLAEGVIPATPLPTIEFVKNQEQALKLKIKEY